MIHKNIGIDLGYGFTKVADGEREFCYPSVVGAGRDLRFRSSIGLNAGPVDNLALRVGGQQYFVGPLAIRQSEMAARSLDEDRPGDPNARVLFLSAVSLFAQWESQLFNIVTGLPTAQFGAYREALKNALRGQGTFRVLQGGEERERTVQVDRVHVVPQPFGTLYDRVLNQIGNVTDGELARLKVGIIDVGFRTTDYAVSDQLEFIEHLSGSTATGVSNAYAMIGDYLRSELKVDRENHELDDIVARGEVRVAGKAHDITPVRRQAYEKVAHKILTEVDSAWDVRDLDVILLTGGGGAVLADHLLPRFKNAMLVDNAQLANVRGFAKLANHLFREG